MNQVPKKLLMPRISLSLALLFCLLVFALSLGLSIWGQACKNVDYGPFNFAVAGDFGAPLALTVSGGVKASDVQVKELIAGKGEKITENTQLLYKGEAFRYHPATGLVTSNEVIFGGNLQDIPPGQLHDALNGVKQGSRIAVVNIPDAKGNTEITVVDILPTTITATSQTPLTQNGFPSFSFNQEQVPVLSQDVTPLDTLTHWEMTTGSGKLVTLEDTIYANYLIADTKGVVLENTWENTRPAKIVISEVFAGLQQTVLDKTEGTKLMIAIPGAQAQGQDLVMIIDILRIAS